MAAGKWGRKTEDICSQTNFAPISCVQIKLLPTCQAMCPVENGFEYVGTKKATALKNCVRTFCMPPTLVRTAPLRKGTAKCEWCRHHPSLISSGLDLQNFVDIFHPCSQLSVRHCLVILGSTSGSHRPLTWQSIFWLLCCNLSRGPIQHQ